MHGSAWYASTAAALLLAALMPSAALSSVPVARHISNHIKESSTTDSYTCSSQSLNYITQTLPQQCLTTSWASKPASQEQPISREALTSKETPGKSTEHRPITEAATNPQGAAPTDSTAIDTTSADVISITSSSIGISSSTSTFEYGGTLDDPSKVEQPTETDSPLDNANFLSFEEWKRQNLAKAGQSAENLGAKAGTSEPRRRPGGINNALDSLGEDTEIEIDFGGFVNTGSSKLRTPPARRGVEEDNSSGRSDGSKGATMDENTGARKRSKDAGKTCKERSNYASFDCAATMLKTNVESKGSNAVLVENRDIYMLNVCSAKNKFFIVELCDDILIDTVVLANFEFFSSMFRTFRVSVSDRYPAKPDKWKNLGSFEARNSREVQAFLVENPLIWARYLRIEILTHFGNEYYCPLSLLRVHGTTMMEEFNHDLKTMGTEEDGESESSDSEEGASIEAWPGVVTAEAIKDTARKTSSPVTEAADQNGVLSTTGLTGSPSNRNAGVPVGTVAWNSDSVFQSGFAPYNFSISKQMEDLLAASDPDRSCGPEDEPADPAPSQLVSLESQQSATSTGAANARGPVITQSRPRIISTAATEVSKSAVASPPSVKPAADKSSFQHVDEPVRPFSETSTTTTKTHSSSTQPPTANPTTQESFFKSVHKRLQLLESNSTLSLQYIEEQSRILRDAFSIVEKRQLAKTSSFLESLNTTVLTELCDFRNQYDQIWQSTVLELSSQRERSQHEVLALSSRLTLLADEIVFHKRMVILQFILILLCLGLAIFSRTGPIASYLELPPLVQNAINRSSVNLSRYTPQFETPPASPSSPRPSTRQVLFHGWTHQRGPSDESQNDGTHDVMKSPSVAYSPPTPPTSQDSSADRGDGFAHVDGEEEMSDESPLAGEGAVREVRSSPATPSGQREEQGDLVDGGLLTPVVGRTK